MADDSLVSALDFSGLSVDDAEIKISEAYEGGLIDLFTYQDLTGKAQKVRKDLASAAKQRRRASFGGGVFGFGISTFLGGVVGGALYGFITSQLRTSATGTDFTGIRSSFLESVEEMAQGSATQSSNLFVARVRATKRLEMAQLGSKRYEV